MLSLEAEIGKYVSAFRTLFNLLLFIQYIEAKIEKSEVSIGVPAPYSNLLSAILLYNITCGKARGKSEIYFLFLMLSS